MDADIRRTPRAPAPSLDSNPELVALIRAEIDRAGAITFARFMELALYTPEIGYYTSASTRIGRRGDFLTAPETHPIFGAAVARQIAEVWRRLGRPGEFVVREYGGGTGALAASILRALPGEDRDLTAATRYEAVEINAHRREELQATVAAIEPTPAFDVLDPASATAGPSAEVGFVIANEFLDAFPVHLVEQTDHGLLEVFVEWHGTAFRERLRGPSTHRLAERLRGEGIDLEPGQRGEIALGIDGWVDEIASWLGSGLVVVIDYGDLAPELYGKGRRAGTLMGYADHRAIDGPLAAVGRQDLTAHVDFTALEAAATRAGLTPLPLATQSGWLIDLGLEELLQRARTDPALTIADYLALRSGVVRLIDPRHTGGFRVQMLARGLDDPHSLPGSRTPRR